MLQLAVIVGSAVAAGRLGLRRDTHFVPVALSFWVAQSVALVPEVQGTADVLETLAAAVLLDGMLGVVPFAVTFGVVRLAAGVRRPASSPSVTWPALVGTVCGRCGPALDPGSWGRCGFCGALFSEFLPVPEVET